MTRPYSRREFLNRGASLIGLSPTVPTFLAGTVAAMCREADGALTASRSGVPDDRILVVVQFAGGNDGLNTLVPYRNDAYYRARPKLAVKADSVIAINDELGWHPKASAFMELWDRGLMHVVEGVGYPNPNRSHFVSSRIWESASPDGKMKDGWIGRYFDHCCRGADAPNPSDAIALTDEVPLALRGERFAPISTANPETFGQQGGGRVRKRHPNGRRRGNNQPNTQEMLVPRPRPGSDSKLDFLRRSTLDAVASAKQIRTAAKQAIDGAKFPQTKFARSLRSVARMIASGLETRVYYVSLPGFDTHANQGPRQGRLLREAGEGLVSLVDALKRTGNLDRTLILTFSEFGRRVEENASGGTDHGQAAPMFLIGKPIRGGLTGGAPRLDKLDGGDLMHTVDFRQVYATVLRDWLGTKPERLLGGRWKSLPLIRT